MPYFFVLLLQKAADFADNQTVATKGTAFALYTGIFYGIIYAVGSVLAIMSAYRIYVNHMTGKDITEGITNYFLGLIALAGVVMLCKSLT